MAAYSMDLSGRRLCTVELAEALSRLTDLLDGEEASEEHDDDRLPRALELIASQNDLRKFSLPVVAPRLVATGRRRLLHLDSHLEDEYSEGGYHEEARRGDAAPLLLASEEHHHHQQPMMDMMLMGWNDDDDDDNDEGRPGSTRGGGYARGPTSRQLTRGPQSSPAPSSPGFSSDSSTSSASTAAYERVAIEDRLTKLDLSRNKLGPKIARTPLSFSSLHRLRHLDLSSNGLVGSPSGLAGLGALVSLVLAENSLRDADGLATLKSLARLDLRSNRIFLPAAVRALSLNDRLVQLDLRGNPICCAGDGRAMATCRAALRSMLPRLSRLGLGGFEEQVPAPEEEEEEHLELFRPISRDQDSYTELHERRKATATTTARQRTARNYKTALAKSQGAAAIVHDSPRRSYDQANGVPSRRRDPWRASSRTREQQFASSSSFTAARTNGTAATEGSRRRRISSPVRGGPPLLPNAVERNREVRRAWERSTQESILSHDDQLRHAWDELPWRAAPSPLPRWMLERELGRETAKAVLQQQQQQHQMSTRNNDDDHHHLNSSNKNHALYSKPAVRKKAPMSIIGHSRQTTTTTTGPRPRSGPPPAPMRSSS